MSPSPHELPALARRGWEVLREEGPRAVWLRAQRRLAGAQGAVFRDYAAWLALEAQGAPASARGDAGPPLSVITPVCDPPPAALAALLESLRAQAHPWELCLADDASQSAEVRRLLERAAGDPRVRRVRLPRRRGIAAATNAALALARHPVVAFADHDDLLAADALAHLAAPFDEPAVDLVYSDEDKLDRRGRRGAPFLKPAFDPLLLLGTNYVGHLLALRRELVERVGGLRSELDGAQDWDLLLRASEAARVVAHVPRVLYHWRAAPGSTAAAPGAKPWAQAAGRRAVEAALARRGDGGRVLPGRWTGCWRVEREPALLEQVSVILEASRAPAWLAGLPVREVLCAGAARARARQAAAERARGSLLLFLGPVRPRGSAAAALRALLAQVDRPGVGFVGGQVVGPTGGVREQGLALGHGPGALAGLPEAGLGPDAPGYFGLAALPRTVAAVGAQALLVPAGLLRALGGWRLDGQAGAVELCWRGAAQGLRAVATPEASFRAWRPAPAHLGGAPEAAALRAALGEAPEDPFWHPGFRRGGRGLRLGAAPPPARARRVRARDGAWRV